MSISICAIILLQFKVLHETKTFVGKNNLCIIFVWMSKKISNYCMNVWTYTCESLLLCLIPFLWKYFVRNIKIRGESWKKDWAFTVGRLGWSTLHSFGRWCKVKLTYFELLLCYPLILHSIWLLCNLAKFSKVFTGYPGALIWSLCLELTGT